MKIKKILNNNVVISDNDRIVMGRGIGFQKNAGASIDEEKIEKTYRLTNDKNSERILELVSEMPFEILKLADEFMDYARETLGKKLQPNSYISLTDHLYTAIERNQKGINIPNFLLWDIKRFFPKEYEVGLHGIQMTKETLNVTLSEDEAGFLALHLVNGEIEENIDVTEMTKLIQEILNVVKYSTGMSFDEQSIYFERFITHLRFFVQRVLKGQIYTQSTEDDELYQVIKRKYMQAYHCVDKIADFLNGKYQYAISIDEKIYLTIHIARIMEVNEN
ncbi:transcriptional antiterminator, BglG family [Pilibacter termitis]|uniref:Transcriptional antiterminator, BglG family n=1 Tax=Pilibacter termitis TaxID=263852 RepID=A0A1T4QLT9_9ENTE|nr:PRD domain-containing protein [Pilibacter termitis]SKA04740.1 transcriptional antiterminator, BglG family [Pilibacter termitis]